MISRTDNTMWKSKTALAAFFLAILAFVISAHNIRQKIIVDPLSKEDRDFVTSAIMKSDELRNKIGSVQEVEFHGGIYIEKLSELSYGVNLITEQDRVGADLRIKRFEHQIVEARLVHLSLNVHEAFLIELLEVDDALGVRHSMSTTSANEHDTTLAKTLTKVGCYHQEAIRLPILGKMFDKFSRLSNSRASCLTGLAHLFRWTHCRSPQ